MNWNKIFTDYQLKKLTAVKNPTVDIILELSKEFNISDEVIFIFFAERNKKNNGINYK